MELTSSAMSLIEVVMSGYQTADGFGRLLMMSPGIVELNELLIYFVSISPAMFVWFSSESPNNDAAARLVNTSHRASPPTEQNQRLESKTPSNLQLAACLVG